MTRVGRGGATAKKRSTDDAQAEDAQILQNQRAQGKPSPKAGPTSAATGRSKRNAGSRSQHQTPLSAPVSAPTAVDEDSGAAALMEPSGSACLLPPPTTALLETPTKVSPTHASVRNVISEMYSSYGSLFPAGVDKAALCTSLCTACDEGSVVHTAGAAIDFDGLAKKVRNCFGQAVANAKPPVDAPPPAMVPELAALRASKQFVEAAKAFLIPQDPAPPVAMPPSVQSTPGVLDAADAAINALAGRQPDPPRKKARGEKGAVKSRAGVLGMPGQPQQVDGSDNGCIQTPENEGGLLSAPGPMMPQGGFTANAFSNDQSMMNQMPIAANGGVGLIFGSNPPPTTISDSMASALGLNFATGGQQHAGAYQHQQQAFIVGQHTGAGTARPPQVSNSRKKEVVFENLPEAFFDVTTSPLDGSCGPESQLLRNLIAHHCNQAEATMQQEWAAQQQFQEQQHASRSGAEKQPSDTAMVYCHDTTLLSRFGFFPGQAPMNHAGAVTVNNNVQGMRLSAESKRAWVRLYDPVAANVIVFVGSKNGELVQGSPTSTRFATQEDTDAVHVAVRGDVAVMESELKNELPTIEGLGDWGAIMCGLPLPEDSNNGSTIAEASSAAPTPEATFEELESKLPTDFKTTEMKNLAETVEEISEKKEELSLMAALGDAVDRQRKLTVLTQLSQLQPQVLPLQTAIRAQKIAKMKELGLPVPAHEWQPPQQDASVASLPQGEAASSSNDATSGASPTPTPAQPAFSSSSGSIENHNALLFFSGAAAPVPDNGVLAVLRALKVTPKRVWRSKDSAAFCVETAGSGEAGRVATKLYHNQGQFMGMTVGRKQQ